MRVGVGIADYREMYIKSHLYEKYNFFHFFHFFELLGHRIDLKPGQYLQIVDSVSSMEGIFEISIFG